MSETTGDKGNQRGQRIPVERLRRECQLRGWTISDLEKACAEAGAKISYHAVWSAWHGERVMPATSLAISLALAKSKDAILPEVAEFLGNGPQEAA